MVFAAPAQRRHIRDFKCAWQRMSFFLFQFIRHVLHATADKMTDVSTSFCSSSLSLATLSSKPFYILLLMSPAAAVVVVRPIVRPLSLNVLESFFPWQITESCRAAEREILENERKRTYEDKQEPNVKSWHHINQVVGISEWFFFFFEAELFEDVCSAVLVDGVDVVYCWKFAQYFNGMTVFVFGNIQPRNAWTRARTLLKY